MGVAIFIFNFSIPLRNSFHVTAIYFLPFFLGARRSNAPLSLAGALLGCLSAPLVIGIATLAVIQLHEVLNNWPKVTEQFDPIKAKMTISNTCYSPDAKSLTVLADIQNTTGRDLMIYTAKIGVTQKNICWQV